MRLGLLESLRRILWRDLNPIGRPVGNLHGPAVVRAAANEVAAAQTWTRYNVTGNGALEPSTIYDQLKYGGAVSVEVAEAGVLSVQASGGLQLLQTTAVTTASQRFTLRVTTDVGGEAAVYVDELLLKTVRGTTGAAVMVNLAPGRHRIRIVSRASQVTVTVPTTLYLDGMQEVLPVPVIERVTSTYHDATTGAARVTVTWPFDYSVGGYRVLRRSSQSVGLVSLATYDENTGTLILEMATATTGLLGQGDFVTTDLGDVGLVLAAYTDEAEDHYVRINVTAPDYLPNSWTNLNLYRSNYTELARVRSDSGRMAEYQDTTPVFGQTYEYALQAFGLLDESQLGPVSMPYYVLAGDTEAPARITFDAGYPLVRNKLAIVKYTTPADADYQGVRVYFRSAPIRTVNVASVAGNVITTAETDMVTNEHAGRFVQLNTSYVRHLVVSNTASTLTLDTMPSAPAAVATDDLVITEEYLVKTDYGLPGTDDELEFEAQEYGFYYFATFDRSGNTQNSAEAASWEYTAADEVYTDGPVLAFRQLSATEQAYFTTDGVEDPKQYAIVEVYAYNRATTDSEDITLYYRRREDLANVTLPLNDAQSGAFPLVVTGTGAAILDDAGGTRSRYILLTRQNPRIELWAVDAQGYSSDRLSMIIDLDTTAAITSLETKINNTNNTASFVAVADDDTSAVGWYVDAETEAVVDTRDNKVVAISGIPLAVGQLRTLTVIPYKSYDDVPPESGIEPGETVVRELARTPRSLVSFEERDTVGDRSSEWITALFNMEPAPTAQVLSTGPTLTTRSGTVSNGPTKLLDAGAAWTVNQWTPSNLKAFFVRIENTAGEVYIRKITSNTATEIFFTGASFTGSVTYQVLDAAVFVRVNDVDNTTQYLPLEREVRRRDVGLRYQFYAVKNGCHPESPRSAYVDADNLPNLTNFRYEINTTTDVLSVLFDEHDDDATTWEVYERRGTTATWPTFSGTAPLSEEDLDPKFLRFEGPIVIPGYDRSSEGVTGVWAAVALARNSFGEAGPLYSDTIDLGTPPTPDPALTSMRVTAPIAATGEIHVEFGGNAQTTGTDDVTISFKRSDQSTPTVISTTMAGSTYEFAVGEPVVASGLARTWEVTVTLDGYNSLTRTITYYTEAPADTVTLTAVSATVSNFGFCLDDNCAAFQSQPHVRTVYWTLNVNGSPAGAGAPYLVAIDVATDAGASNWVTIATNIPPTQTTYQDELYCMYSDVGGATTYWTYRVRAYPEAGGSNLDTETATQIVDYLHACDGLQY